jgi:hypothetical protein
VLYHGVDFGAETLYPTQCGSSSSCVDMAPTSCRGDYRVLRERCLNSKQFRDFSFLISYGTQYASSRGEIIVLL